MANVYFDSNGLTAAFPGCLGGPPSRFGFYVWRNDGAFCFHNFHATYAAKEFIDTLLQGSPFKWINAQTILSNNGFKIKAEYHCSLEEVIEYTPKGKEQDFEFPVPYNGMFSRFARIALAPEGHVEAPTRQKEPKKERAPSEPRPDGLISLADIVAELGIEPRDARQILRKSDLEKPSYGWAWPSSEVDRIKKLLKAA